MTKTRRWLALIGLMLTTAAPVTTTPSAPASTAPHQAYGGCAAWQCGTNHNQVRL